ncbi:energy transducer TonB [Polaromonas sp. JS666]|uniref:energy transducer TonB n=1 Tax=Polaromonas sp. (strain JS666 / ATCC BAA-500) TaxID=296591 RepID=UPI00004640BA|nr:TonB C-terminal domain-containing protein [Polaromonas sp. JS666]ABE43040.1 TonB-like protein [Polaromonas sp. JS666]
MKSPSTLQIALGASIAFHAVLLTVRFVDPERFNRVFQDTPLEVILVNAKSREKPDFAKAIAQASLAGGGQLEKGRATSPLPPSALTEMGDASDETQRQIESLHEQQTQLLTQIKKQLATMPPPDMTQAATNPAHADREEKRRQLVKILAEIERRINEENARPKKRYISPATREEVYAVYYDELRRKIEDKGTVNFPELAGKKLYGELTMVMTVNFDGRILDTEVAETSGNLTLDRRAQSIVRGTGPFGRFTEAMRRKADQIVVVSRFKFTRDDTLETRLTSR